MPTLFPFQQQGAQFLATHRIALLADEMGLGKSAQAVTAFDLTHSENILILCPASLRANWIHELQKFSLHGRSGTPVYAMNERPTAPLVVCSYDLTRSKPMLSTLLARKWDTLCLDEAHYLTSTTAQRTAAVLGSNGLIHKATRTWFLTGTPMRNHPGELWPMMYTAGLTPMAHEQFVAKYCETVRKEVFRGKWVDKVVGAKQAMIPALRQMLAPILLRRTKAEVLPEMPPITLSEVVVEPCEVDEEIYFHGLWRARQNVAEMTRSQLEGMVSSAETDEALLKLLDDMRTKMNDTRRYIGLQKVKGTIELARTMLDGGVQKLVIFAWHKHVMHQITDALREYGAVQVYGETPPEKRDKYVQWFQNPTGRCRVLVGQVLAAGVGYTMTAASHVLMVEPSWVPADNMQAIMRVHRIGQDRPVTVQYVMLAGNVVEQRVIQTLRRKTEDFVSIFG